jgi:hypothetical protein
VGRTLLSDAFDFDLILTLFLTLTSDVDLDLKFDWEAKTGQGTASSRAKSSRHHRPRPHTVCKILHLDAPRLRTSRFHPSNSRPDAHPFFVFFLRKRVGKRSTGLAGEVKVMRVFRLMQ